MTLPKVNTQFQAACFKNFTFVFKNLFNSKHTQFNEQSIRC